MNRFNPGNINFLIVKILLIRRIVCDPTVAGSSRTQVGLLYIYIYTFIFY